MHAQVAKLFQRGPPFTDEIVLKEFQLDGFNFFSRCSCEFSRFNLFISVRRLFPAARPSWNFRGFQRFKQASVPTPRKWFACFAQPDKRSFANEPTVYIYEWKCIRARRVAPVILARAISFCLRYTPLFLPVSLFLFRGSRDNWSVGPAAGRYF